MKKPLLLASLIFFAACPGDDDPTPGETPDASVTDATLLDATSPALDAEPVVLDAAPPCTPIVWHVDVDSLTAGEPQRGAEIADGALVLSSEGDRNGAFGGELAPLSAIKVYQQHLRGDFRVEAEVALVGDTPLAGVQLFVTAPGGPGFAYARMAVGGDSGARLTVEDLTGEESTEQTVAAVTTHTAALTISRTGEVVRLEARQDNQWVTVELVSSAELFVGLALDDAGEAAPFSARVEHFSVEGGGGDVLADDFVCDAVLHE